MLTTEVRCNVQRKLIAIAGGLLLVTLGAFTIRLSREYFARLVLGASSRATAQQGTQLLLNPVLDARWVQEG